MENDLILSSGKHGTRVSPGIDSGPAVSVQKGGGGGARQRHQAVKQTLKLCLVSPENGGSDKIKKGDFWDFISSFI
jgi:hypothetical protein